MANKRSSTVTRVKRKTQASNGEYKIERGIPVPPPGKGKHPKYPFRQMVKGDSFVAPQRAQPGLYTTAKRLGIVIRTARISDDTIRVWHCGEREQ